MRRRTFLAAAASAALAADNILDIIDTHTHFYDPTRPQGVPWPPKTDAALYRPVLPPEFVRMTAALGVAGTIEVEASAWLEDNQWVLDLAAKHPVIVGTVGHLPLGAEFPRHLERFAKNPLFRGIRLGGNAIPGAHAELQALADAGLELDALGGAAMLADIARLTDRVPRLRVVIDHLPFDPAAAYDAGLRELKSRPRVYAKVSNVLRRDVAPDVANYRGPLDQLWEVFGPDRVIYGSNWPVSDHVAPYTDVLKVVREYFTAKGAGAARKYFRDNSHAAYGRGK